MRTKEDCGYYCKDMNEKIYLSLQLICTQFAAHMLMIMLYLFNKRFEIKCL